RRASSLSTHLIAPGQTAPRPPPHGKGSRPSQAHPRPKASRHGATSAQIRPHSSHGESRISGEEHSRPHDICWYQMRKLLAISLLALAACGTTPGERAVTGGLIGAGAGAGAGAIVGGSPLAGALLGGGAGALTGALTAPRHRYHHRRYHRYR